MKKNLTIACALAALGSGCMSNPADGTAVTSTGTVIAFGGYVNDSPSRPVVVEARDPRTGAFMQVGPTAMTDAEPYVELWGIDWHAWTLSSSIPAAFWVPGSTGAAVTVRARALGASPTNLYGVNERFWTCLNQSETVNEFSADCTEPGEITLCTRDFLPFSSRRSHCPRRGLLERRADGKEAFHRFPERTTTLTLAEGLRSVDYRGDAVSVIDVFDEAAGSDGFSVGGANVVRIRYAGSRASTPLESYDPAAIAAARGTPPGLPWRGARTFRQYDLGECSAFFDWRRLMSSVDPATGRPTGIIPALELAVQTSSESSRLIPTGTRTTLRPLLRPDGRDGISLTARFHVETRKDLPDWTRVGYILVQANVQLSSTPVMTDASGNVSGGRFVASLEAGSTFDFTATNAGAFLLFLGGRSEESVEAQVRNAFADSLGSAVRSLLPGALAFVHVDRVHTRPDGLELVLAESRTDPDFALASPRGFCSRPDPSPAGIQTGLLFTFFDPPLSTDPRPFGDTRP